METTSSNRSFDYSASAGFTLHELLIVIVIAGVMALAVAAGSEHLRSLPLQRATQLLSADIEYARIRSIGNPADPCVVVFHKDGDGYHVARRSDPDSPLTSAGETIVYFTHFGRGRGQGMASVTCKLSESIEDGMVPFTGFGSLNQGANAIIELQAGDRAVRITIDAATGDLSVHEASAES